MNHDPQHADVAIVGGGPAGALAALGFARAGRRVVVFESRERDAVIDDARALALSWASRQRLAEAGAWPEQLPASLIDCVHVSQQGAWGRTVIRSADTGLPHLGLVVDYPALTRAIDARLEAAGVDVQWGRRVTGVHAFDRYVALRSSGRDGERQLTARLAVLADGGALIDQLPPLRRHVHDYRQSALLAQVRTEVPHGGVAYERFSRAGPLALLPHGDGFMLVWTRSHEDAARLRDGAAEDLRAELQTALGGRHGRVLSVSAPAVFPLAMRRASRTVCGRVALIGNAAQTLHPVAAQGLNLGIRDAVALVDATQSCRDPGDAPALAGYRDARRFDREAVTGFTHALVGMFDRPNPAFAFARGLGMNLLDTVPALRRRFAGHLVFGVGVRT
jgi:2-octaprenyl-6-methoxyphenol hydroxylase